MAMTSQLGRAGAESRHWVVLSRGALIAACALLAAACGSTAAPSAGSGGSSPAGASGTPSAAAVSSSKVSLDVTFGPTAGHAAKHWTLRCEPAGGNYPDPPGACAKLLKWGDIFARPIGHVMCPMIMTTAQRITVTGTYFGKKINETIVAGGCDLSRYYKLRQVFN
ncbi:MAG TPA: SSI family serine proteinase inhibitor [Streptosporangiaceae bacterium]|jgi:hypothetical protein